MNMQLDVVLGLVGINVVLLMLLVWRSISKSSHDDAAGIPVSYTHLRAHETG
jgi:hypothetical protein